MHFGVKYNSFSQLWEIIGGASPSSSNLIVFFHDTGQEVTVHFTITHHTFRKAVKSGSCLIYTPDISRIGSKPGGKSN